ncbi:tetratricopeptide repeat protein [Azospirillum sp. TSO35-2]|uniref:tetratricopeptide repeat protein n=1 Tax=Azospirillum sp. TSO35-2 TaxID=716796 RepID=UPI000D65000D|nr:tetratricopeptide repeat protein [Azospirillum sp. TSO35-2]
MTRRNAYLSAALPAPLMAVLMAVLCSGATLSSAARAADPGPDRNRELQACATKAEGNPDGALADAKRWQDQGGGDRARLCQALALFHKGDFKAAGAQMEALVPTMGKDDPRAAASLLGRAGWAWLRAGDQGRAEKLYSAALDKAPGDVDLLIDRAFARAEGERFWDAITDLDAALGKDPKRADAYLYRASAHKALSNYRQALADIDQALELKPGDPEAVLLRGNVKALGGNLTAARDDWALARRLAPDSEWGRAAADNLDRTAKAVPDAGKDTGKDKPKPKAP